MCELNDAQMISHGYWRTNNIQVDYDEAIFLWGIDKKDFFLWAVTFITTLIFGIEIGVLVGVNEKLYNSLQICQI